MKKSFLFVSCEEAQHICDKAQYDEAGLWEKIKLNIRLTWCRVTRAYYKRNIKLTKTVKESQVECLDIKDKDSMKKDFEKALKKHSL